MTLSSSSFDVAGREAAVPAVDMPRAARLVLRMMLKLSVGSLTVRLPGGRAEQFGHGAPHGEIVLANWKVCKAVLKSGDIGFGESYIAGDWSTPDLLSLMNVMVANRSAIEKVVYGTWWGRLLYRIRHLTRRNSRTGSKKNIHAHYDIGNAFYRLWLDETMTYSSALFADDRPAADTEAHEDFAALPLAQAAKYDRVLDRLAVAPGAHVLEIGCGWGGFATSAAARGLRVTGLTLSTEQRALAIEQLASAGHEEAVTIALQDYRDLEGQYDGIASIEMFEAVGEAYWADYFAAIKRHLKPGGRAVVQTITIADRLFDEYRSSSDFIQQYIFPGGMLPSATAFERATRAAGLRIIDRFAFGQHYSRTLAAWLARFNERESAVREHGFDTSFLHTWRFYLAYCAAAFRFESTDVMQFTLEHARP
jgi:cyclopropane-fatty-acyl-phospholipid synthase